MPAQTERIRWRNGYVCDCIVTSMPMIEQRLKDAGVIKNSVDIFQYCYNSTVAASAGTHDRGGVLDMAQLSDTALRVFRECGVAAQHRTVAQGFSGAHNHAFWIGCPHMSPGLAYQQSEYLNGRNGLVSRGPITGPKVKPITWKQALSDYNKKQPPVGVIDKEDIFDMSSVTKLTTSKDLHLASNKWESLKLTDAGSYTILKGPATFIVTAYVEIMGLPKGRELQLRFATIDTKNNQTSDWVNSYPIQEVVGTGGTTFGQITFMDSIGAGAKGWSRGLRLRANVYDKNVTISRVWLRAIKG